MEEGRSFMPIATVRPMLQQALRLVRGLRFRLTVSYVLLFTVLLIAIGFVFRQNLKS